MQENVWASFFDAHGGETEGAWVANAATYGADKLLVLLKPIAVELDDEPEPSPAPGAAGPSGARGADGGAGCLLCRIPPLLALAHANGQLV